LLFSTMAIVSVSFMRNPPAGQDYTLPVRRPMASARAGAGAGKMKMTFLGD